MLIQVALMLPPDAVSVPWARHVVSAALTRAGVAAECVDDVEVAVSEACTNAYRHSSADGHYEVTMEIRDEHLTIDVLDSGVGFQQAQVPRAMSHVSAENGRGLALIAAYCDSALFDSVSGSGGAVHLNKRLRWVEGAPWSRLASAGS
ncbi:MAG TPA: ATP-binding protein [Nocardioidaceae bacterium]|nr:ATP-binding protein [Nocardioidaceae bacterium]